MREETLSVLRREEVDLAQCFRRLPQSVRERCERVAKVTGGLLSKAKAEGMFEEEGEQLSIERIEHAALYYEIGLLLIPEQILCKAQEWTGPERKIYERHAPYGAKLIERYRLQRRYPAAEEPVWRLAAEIALNHHERWDGKGFPYGALTNAAPLPARALALADAYDCIVYGTPRRMPLPAEYALLELMDGAGRQFDPRLSELLRRNHPLLQDAGA